MAASHGVFTKRNLSIATASGRSLNGGGLFTEVKINGTDIIKWSLKRIGWSMM